MANETNKCGTLKCLKFRNTFEVQKLLIANNSIRALFVCSFVCGVQQSQQKQNEEIFEFFRQSFVFFCKKISISD